MVTTGKMLAFINALGGGAAAPSEVVILPETVLTVDDGQALIAGPLQAPVSAGDTVSITYNGTEYECTGVDGGAADFRNVAFGNLAAMGATGGNPDAPFVVVLAPDGGDFDGDGVIDNGCYGGVMPLDGSTTITLSIVQVGAASGGESAGGYLYITGTAEDSEADSVNVTMSMPFEVVLAAVYSGKPVFCALHNFKGNTMVYVLQVVGYSDWAMIFGSSDGQTVIEMMWTETNGCVARLIT